MNLKKCLDETVHDLFIEQLYSGKYHTGQRIDPAELAVQFSISRTPVVQALKQLANERVLVVDRGGKYFITVPTEKMLKDVCDVRCLLEQYAITLLIQNHDPAAMEELLQIVQENKRLWEAGREIESIHCCREFHKKFVEKTGNTCLLESYLPVLYQYGGIKYALGSEWRTHKNLGDWHLEIVKYVMENEEEKAKKLTQEHIDWCRQDILQRMRELEKLEK